MTIRLRAFGHNRQRRRTDCFPSSRTRSDPFSPTNSTGTGLSISAWPAPTRTSMAPVRRWHGTGGLGHRAEPGRDAGTGEARFGRGDAEDVDDQVTSGRGAPAVHGRTAAPAFAEGVVAVDKELLPAPHEPGEQFRPSGAGDSVVNDVAEERLGEHDFALHVPIDAQGTA